MAADRPCRAASTRLEAIGALGDGAAVVEDLNERVEVDAVGIMLGAACGLVTVPQVWMDWNVPWSPNALRASLKGLVALFVATVPTGSPSS